MVLLLLAVAITANLAGLFELPVLTGRMQPAGGFATGALAAFVATPCAGPFVGAALGTALLLSPAGSIAVFAALGLGLAFPFLLVAFHSHAQKPAAETGVLDEAPPTVSGNPDGRDSSCRTLAALPPGGFDRPPYGIVGSVLVDSLPQNLRRQSARQGQRTLGLRRPPCCRFVCGHFCNPIARSCGLCTFLVIGPIAGASKPSPYTFVWANQFSSTSPPTGA